VRKQACAFCEILENRAVLKSGSKLPHSEGATLGAYGIVFMNTGTQSIMAAS
jgi:hypothetical protein